MPTSCNFPWIFLFSTSWRYFLGFLYRLFSCFLLPGGTSPASCTAYFPGFYFLAVLPRLLVPPIFLFSTSWRYFPGFLYRLFSCFSFPGGTPPASCTAYFPSFHFLAVLPRLLVPPIFLFLTSRRYSPGFLYRLFSFFLLPGGTSPASCTAYFPAFHFPAVLSPLSMKRIRAFARILLKILIQYFIL